MRRLVPHRSTALLAAGALAAAGLVVLTAPPAQADQVAYTSQCTNKLAPGLEIPPSETKVDIQVSPAKEKYAVGDLITVHWLWGSYSKVPISSPIEALPADSTKPVGRVAVGGAQTGEVVVEGERKNPLTPRGEELVVTDMKATLTLTAAGTVDFSPAKYSTFSLVFGIDAETECLPLTTPGVSASITVEPGQAVRPVLDAPTGEAHPGWTLGLTGSGFAPNAVPLLKLCDATGSGCLAERFKSSALVIDGAGKLSGTATLADRQLPDGDYMISVVDGVAEAQRPLTVTTYVPPGPRTVRAEPAAGPVGTTTTLTGTGWTPNAGVNIAQVDASGSAGGGTISLITDHTGAFSTPFTVSSPLTTQIRVREGLSSVKRVFIPFTLLTVAPIAQDATVTLVPGSLSMTQDGTGIDFGTATLDGEEHTLPAALNQVTVTDSRGSDLGWSLTGTMTDLTAANGQDKIPAGNLSWTPSCAAAPSSLDQAVGGTAGPLGPTAALLCGVTPDGSTTGGRFTADAQLSLRTPGFTAAGAYTGTLTLTLT
ncbi:WxL domain-containing protein [Yinghuangia soli]|uniref:WxL domain-containing protein n=1 Tax=Yinghuangia soli TaxID=2908204 RepID=A0AA41Q7U0_9ACTN|nr:WxL domain-containing protein [Yinghuangia soli]MCF2531969.1 WxL domain-containing protein [Yinghuangia soli]